MNNLFVYLEIENGIVQEVSLELLTKGRALATRLGCQLEAVAISNCSTTRSHHAGTRLRSSCFVGSTQWAYGGLYLARDW